MDTRVGVAAGIDTVGLMENENVVAYLREDRYRMFTRIASLMAVNSHLVLNTNAYGYHA